MDLLIFLSIGTLAMLIPIMLQGSWYRVKWNNRILIAILLTVAGTLGTLLLYYFENGRFGGTSFFGAVFFVPILFIPVAKILRIRLDVLMDLCAPAECMMLVIMKIQCMINGCCSGRQIILAGNQFVFPSQFLELMSALIIGVVLLLMSRKENNKGTVYPWYMAIYGVSRFALNIGREAWVLKEMILPFGNIWALLATIGGIIWLIIWKKKFVPGVVNG